MAATRAAPAQAHLDLDIQRISIEDLLLDPKNPRLRDADVPSDLSGAGLQKAMLESMWEDMAIDELIYSIAANGFLPYEPLFAIKDGSKYYVVEGNRRLAAVKLLRDATLRRELKVELPELKPLGPSQLKQLDTLPVVVEKDRRSLWEYLALRHINGPSAWRSYSKAQFIATVRKDTGESLEDIARKIGDRHSTVVRLYDALMVLEQAEELREFSRSDRYKGHLAFSHLYTGLSYPGVRKYLGLPQSERPKNAEAPIPKLHHKKLGYLLKWLFGSAKTNTPPLVRSQNPDLRLLEEALNTKRGPTALEQGLPLQTALDIGRGDEIVLRDAVFNAREHLQIARKVFLTGFKPANSELVDQAREVLDLSNALVEDMKRVQSKGRAGAS